MKPIHPLEFLQSRNPNKYFGNRIIPLPFPLLLVLILGLMFQRGLSATSLIQAAEPTPGKIPTNTATPPSGGTHAGAVHARTFLSDFEFWLSVEILFFGFGVLAVEYFLLRKAGITAEETLRVYAVTLIIVGTLFLITAGFDSNQIAPAMGLFGTIAGYLLGKRVSEPTTTRPKAEQQ
jgi:hypothetical protein